MDILRRLNVIIIGIKEREMREYVSEAKFRDQVTENFQNLNKDTNKGIQ